MSSIAFANALSSSANRFSAPASNRRKTRRVALSVPVRHGAGDGTSFSYSYTLSPGGLFVRAPRPPPVGATIRLTLQLGPGRPHVQAVGEVVHAHSREDKAAGPAGFGVRFTDMDEEDQDTLGDCLDEALRSGL